MDPGTFRAAALYSTPPPAMDSAPGGLFSRSTAPDPPRSPASSSNSNTNSPSLALPSSPRPASVASSFRSRRSTSKNFSSPSPPPNDPVQLLHVMRDLKGRKDGWLDWKKGDDWRRGYCSIDQLDGSLAVRRSPDGHVFDTLAPDLRLCQVRTVDIGKKGVVIEIAHPGSPQAIVMIRPKPGKDFQEWLAALLCWQPIKVTPPPSRAPTSPSLLPEPAARHISAISPTSGLDSSADGSPTIIKVGRMNLWDHNAKPTRTSKHNPSWKRVSCILKDNGDLFVYAEADASLLHHVHLTHCTRTDIQLLDPSLLLHTFAFAIYPSAVSPEEKPLLPLYLSVDNRPLLEVWFVLLRCYTTPELYGPPNGDWADGFRISRTLYFRIVDGRQVGKNTWSVENEDRAIDSYCEVLLDGGVRSRTCVKKGTSKPFWREDYLFSDLPPLHSNLLVVIRSYNKRGKDVAIGQVDLNLSELKRDETFEGWHPVRYHREGIQEHAGDLCLKIRIEEQAVLMSAEYEPLREMLQNFEQHLTPNLSKIVTDLERLADILLRIYQASNLAIDWLMYLAEVEILGPERNDRPALSSLMLDSPADEKATKTAQMDANILFRGNSLLTKAVDSHMKRAGADYLEETLGDILRSIAEENVFCEVDPMRLCTPEDLKQNWRMLMALTRQIWQAIKDSVQRCPMELRKIFAHIRAQVEERYGAMLMTVRYTAVSGFLFLRFFCPSVLNPKLFGLMREHPDLKAQRTLTLVAKSLQGLANMSRFGVKEPWMAPMNEFLDESMRDFRKFIDRVCSPPTMLFVSNPVQPIYQAPAQVKARLPQPSREGIPTLPYLIDQPRDCAALISFWLKWYGEQPPSSKPKLEGPLLKFHRLCCALDKRTRALVESAEMAADKSSVRSLSSYPQGNNPPMDEQQPSVQGSSGRPSSPSIRPGTADTTSVDLPRPQPQPPTLSEKQVVEEQGESTVSSSSNPAQSVSANPPTTSSTSTAIVKKSKPGSSLSHVLGGLRLTKSKHT